jgi:hypothetical protein
MNWLMSSLAAGLLVAVACVAPAEIPPATAQFEPTARERVLARALTVLEERGYVLAVTDGLDGLLITKPKDSQMKVRLERWTTREVVQVYLVEDGAAIVNIDSEVLTPDMQHWTPITGGEAGASIQRRQEQLLTEILAELKVSTNR